VSLAAISARALRPDYSPGARAQAAAQAAAIVTRSGTSFALGMKILSPERRAGMFAVYAFCRVIDDIADEGGTLIEKRAGLHLWRGLIADLYAGRRVEDPVAVALEEPIYRFALPQREFELLIEGMEMDAEGPVIAPDWDRLVGYCRRVAGAVGMLSMPIFGAPAGAASDRFALALGEALQLTNILRDVGEDAQLGRLYLPGPLLDAHGVPRAPLTALASPGLGPVRAEMAARARAKFTEAREALRALDWRVLRPALLMMGMYEAYLQRVTRQGFARIAEPARLSRLEKLAIALRYFYFPPLRQGA